MTDYDQLHDVALADQELPFALEPLADFKDHLTIIQGLSGKSCGGGHSNNFGSLGVYSGVSGPLGETIDAALAKARPSIFPRVGLGISERPEHTLIYNISAWDRDRPLPCQCRPDLAYNALFGRVAAGGGRAAFTAQTNVLDFMVEDVKRVESGLAGEERERLQHYLRAYEAMRHRQSRLNEIESTLRKQGPIVTDKYRSTGETDRLDAHFDLAAAALTCGLTNVVTIASGAGDNYMNIRFKGLGIDLAKHNIGHAEGYQGKNWVELSSTIRRFHFELIARLAAKLKEVPEGDGTMFDNTVIVYLSDSAEAHHSRCVEWPFVLVGKLGGKLKAGRYLAYPRYGRRGHRTIASLYCTLLHAAGAPRDSFGVADPNLKDAEQNGPLAELIG